MLACGRRRRNYEWHFEGIVSFLLLDWYFLGHKIRYTDDIVAGQNARARSSHAKIHPQNYLTPKRNSLHSHSHSTWVWRTRPSPSVSCSIPPLPSNMPHTTIDPGKIILYCFYHHALKIQKNISQLENTSLYKNYFNASPNTNTPPLSNRTRRTTTDLEKIILTALLLSPRSKV